METSTKTIECPVCKSKLRFPSDKHIRFKCPDCHFEMEFDKGNYIPGKLKEYKPKTNHTKPILISIAGILILIALIYKCSCNATDNESIKKEENSSNAESDSLNVFESDTLSWENEMGDLTAAKTDSLDSKLQDFLQDLAEEALDKLMEELEKEAEKGNWEKANEAYNKAMDEMQKAGAKGRKMIKSNEKKLSDLKNLLVSLNPDKQDFSFSSDPKGIEKNVATCVITNSTDYNLTLYYSGKANKILILKPRESREFTLPKGLYSISAKVDDPSVREYFGTENFEGYTYPSEFYIETKRI